MSSRSTCTVPGPGFANGSRRVDAVSKRIPPDAAASDGIQGVEVAGIEAARRSVELLVQGADLR